MFQQRACEWFSFRLGNGGLELRSLCLIRTGESARSADAIGTGRMF